MKKTLENFGKDFDFSSESNLGGDSAEEDYDLECNENRSAQNKIFNNDVVFKTWTVERQSTDYV